MLPDLIQPWQGEAYRHLPDGDYNVYDFQYARLSRYNRWNVQGEPTLYLASSLDVASAEWSRHFQYNRSKELTVKTKRRRVYCFQVRLQQTLNLCRPKVWKELSLQNVPHCFLDKEQARATARFLRVTTQVEAIFVPSMAFLDQLEQWVLVIFLEKLGGDPRQFLPQVETFGYLNVES